MVEVKVTFEYEAEQDDELSIKVGDIIKNVSMSEGGWWEGELNGKKGLFPDNFVKVVKNPEQKESIEKDKKDDILRPGNRASVRDLASKLGSNPVPFGVPPSRRKDSSQKKKMVKVIYNYEPENQDELELQKGDILELLKQEEEGWWQGSLNGKVGMFPSNFVELIDDKDVEEKTDKSEKEGSEVKGKKVVGVGLGNIFSDGPIKLRSVNASARSKPGDKSENKKKDESSVAKREKSELVDDGSHNILSTKSTEEGVIDYEDKEAGDLTNSSFNSLSSNSSCNMYFRGFLNNDINHFLPLPPSKSGTVGDSECTKVNPNPMKADIEQTNNTSMSEHVLNSCIDSDFVKYQQTDDLYSKVTQPRKQVLSRTKSYPYRRSSSFLSKIRRFFSGSSLHNKSNKKQQNCMEDKNYQILMSKTKDIEANEFEVDFNNKNSLNNVADHSNSVSSLEKYKGVNEADLYLPNPSSESSLSDKGDLDEAKFERGWKDVEKEEDSYLTSLNKRGSLPAIIKNCVNRFKLQDLLHKSWLKPQNQTSEMSSKNDVYDSFPTVLNENADGRWVSPHSSQGDIFAYQPKFGEHRTESYGKWLDYSMCKFADDMVDSTLDKIIKDFKSDKFILKSPRKNDNVICVNSSEEETDSLLAEVEKIEHMLQRNSLIPNSSENINNSHRTVEEEDASACDIFQNPMLNILDSGYPISNTSNSDDKNSHPNSNDLASTQLNGHFVKRTLKDAATSPIKEFQYNLSLFDPSDINSQRINSLSSNSHHRWSNVSLTSEASVPKPICFNTSVSESSEKVHRNNRSLLLDLESDFVKSCSVRRKRHRFWKNWKNKEDESPVKLLSYKSLLEPTFIESDLNVSSSHVNESILLTTPVTNSFSSHCIRNENSCLNTSNYKTSVDHTHQFADEITTTFSLQESFDNNSVEIYFDHENDLSESEGEHTCLQDNFLMEHSNEFQCDSIYTENNCFPASSTFLDNSYDDMQQFGYNNKMVEIEKNSFCCASPKRKFDCCDGQDDDFIAKRFPCSFRNEQCLSSFNGVPLTFSNSNLYHESNDSESDLSVSIDSPNFSPSFLKKLQYQEEKYLPSSIDNSRNMKSFLNEATKPLDEIFQDSFRLDNSASDCECDPTMDKNYSGKASGTHEVFESKVVMNTDSRSFVPTDLLKKPFGSDHLELVGKDQRSDERYNQFMCINCSEQQTSGSQFIAENFDSGESSETESDGIIDVSQIPDDILNDLSVICGSNDHIDFDMRGEEFSWYAHDNRSQSDFSSSNEKIQDMTNECVHEAIGHGDGSTDSITIDKSYFNDIAFDLQCDKNHSAISAILNQDECSFDERTERNINDYKREENNELVVPVESDYDYESFLDSRNSTVDMSAYYSFTATDHSFFDDTLHNEEKGQLESSSEDEINV